MSLTRKRSVLIKRQSVLGSLETLVAADGIGDLASMDMPKLDPKRINTDNVAQQDFGHTKARYDAAAAVLPMKLSIPVYAASAAGSVPGNGVGEVLAGICGLLEMPNAGVSVVYAPQTPNSLLNIADSPAASLEIVDGGESWPMVDTRGTAKLVGKPSQDLLLEVDCKAPCPGPTLNATPAAVAIPAGDPLRFAGACAFTKDAAGIDIGSIEFDIGGSVVEDPYSGGTRILVNNRKPLLTIPTNAVLGEGKWGAILSATQFTLVATWTGMVLSCTARRSDMTPQDQNGEYGNSEVFEVLDYTLTF